MTYVAYITVKPGEHLDTSMATFSTEEQLIGALQRWHDDCQNPEDIITVIYTDLPFEEAREQCWMTNQVMKKCTSCRAKGYIHRDITECPNCEGLLKEMKP